MKTIEYICIVAESYAEEQAILNRYPGVFWLPGTGDGTSFARFYVQLKNKDSVMEFVNEWNTRRPNG